MGGCPWGVTVNIFAACGGTHASTVACFVVEQRPRAYVRAIPVDVEHLGVVPATEFIPQQLIVAPGSARILIQM